MSSLTYKNSHMLKPDFPVVTKNLKKKPTNCQRSTVNMYKTLYKILIRKTFNIYGNIECY